MPRFRVVDNDDVDALDSANKGIARVLDPEIHRIERDQLSIGHLLANTALQVRLNIAEEQQSGTFRFVRYFRLKVSEDVQMRVHRLSDVQIVLVTTAPAKRLAVFNSFDVVRVDATTLKNFLLSKVTTYDCDDAYFGKKAGRDRKVRGGAAKHLVAFTKRSFDLVISNRTDN